MKVERRPTCRVWPALRGVALSRTKRRRSATRRVSG
jgi:hypothetical protein